LGLSCQIALQLQEALNDHNMVKTTQGQGQSIFACLSNWGGSLNEQDVKLHQSLPLKCWTWLVLPSILFAWSVQNLPVITAHNNNNPRNHPFRQLSHFTNEVTQSSEQNFATVLQWFWIGKQGRL